MANHTRRREREVEHGARYETVPPLYDGPVRLCFYCGDPASAWDHTPPISRVEGYRAFDLAHEQYLLVASCAECNALLGDSLQCTLLDRHKELKVRLQRRYRGVLRSGEWDVEEMQEMSPTLRRHLSATTAMRQDVERRLSYEDGLWQWFDSLDLSSAAA